MINLIEKGFIQRVKTYLAYPLGFLLILGTLLGSYAMLEFSVRVGAEFPDIEPTFALLNIATLAVLYAVIFILCNRVWLSGFLVALFSGIIAVINYYVIVFHGMPLSFLQLKSFTTAMNVISSYTFTLDYPVERIILRIGLILVANILFGFFFKQKKYSVKVRLVLDVVLCILCVLVIHKGYFAENPIKPRQTLDWSWTVSYPKYGYAACTIESIERYFNAFAKPENYSEAAVDEIEILPPEKTAIQKPDIILILNETMYDLSVISDIQTDIPYFENMKNMDNAFMGYAVVPSQGGGTNNSEYELLTSNSLHLIPGSAPFNNVDLNGANSIVSVMNALGYQTLGAHSEPAENYSRGRAYPALGFDEYYFDVDFKNSEYYYNRSYKTDICVYNNLYHWYEQMRDDAPRFLYALTIQNHGQWDMNPPEYDIVHTKNDYGDHTESINEFLTCMYLTDQAFVELTDYFSKQDRPVIICMVGDHCPTLTDKVADPSYSEVEKAFLYRTVPMIIWANYPLENIELGTMGINFVVPTLMEIADVPLTPYYKYILDMKKAIPVITSMGRYMDSDGNVSDYNLSDTSEKGTLIRNYFYLEYQNLTSSRNRDWYQPYE